MREELIAYMQENYLDNDGFPLLQFIPEFDPWESYLQHITKSNTYGDQQTLNVAANLYNVKIHVVSTLDAEAAHTFQPVSSNATATNYVSLFAENHGEHYLGLSPWSPDSSLGGGIPL